ncbi:hypothetical protein KKH23_07425 [Patescibacteria group bacterium]|nr:hypothetical protein [Patescibacteria group bacterium]
MTELQKRVANRNRENENRECCSQCGQPFVDDDDVMEVARGKVHRLAHTAKPHNVFDKQHPATYCHEKCLHANIECDKGLKKDKGD